MTIAFKFLPSIDISPRLFPAHLLVCPLSTAINNLLTFAISIVDSKMPPQPIHFVFFKCKHLRYGGDIFPKFGPCDGIRIGEGRACTIVWNAWGSPNHEYGAEILYSPLQRHTGYHQECQLVSWFWSADQCFLSYPLSVPRDLCSSFPFNFHHIYNLGQKSLGHQV